MVKINEGLLEKVSKEASESPRKRKNYNFHKEYKDSIQRLLNAMEPETYVQPHKHENPDKREVFILLKGSVMVVEFDMNGSISDHIILNKESGNIGVEIASRVYHTIISLEPGSIIYEIKDGPYSIADDKNFAKWAPKENDPEALEFNKKILKQFSVKQLL